MTDIQPLLVTETEALVATLRSLDERGWRTPSLRPPLRSRGPLTTAPPCRGPDRPADPARRSTSGDAH